MQIAESPKFPEPIFSPSIAAPEEEGRKGRTAEVDNCLLRIISVAWPDRPRMVAWPKAWLGTLHACMSVQPCHTLQPSHPQPLCLLAPLSAAAAFYHVTWRQLKDSSFSACASAAPPLSHCMPALTACSPSRPLQGTTTHQTTAASPSLTVLANISITSCHLDPEYTADL